MVDWCGTSVMFRAFVLSVNDVGTGVNSSWVSVGSSVNFRLVSCYLSSVVMVYFRFRCGLSLSSGTAPDVYISCGMTSCLARGFWDTGRTSTPSRVRAKDHYGYFRLTFVVRTSHDERRRGVTGRRGISQLAGGYRTTYVPIHGNFSIDRSSNGMSRFIYADGRQMAAETWDNQNRVKYVLRRYLCRKTISTVIVTCLGEHGLIFLLF